MPKYSFDTRHIIWSVCEPLPVWPVAFWGAVLGMMVTAVFLRPFLTCSTAGLSFVCYQTHLWSTLDLPFILHWQLSQNRLFHILTYAIWWLACLFPKFLYRIHIPLRAFPRLCSSSMKIASHWQIYQLISMFPKYQSYIQRITELEGTSRQSVPELLLMRVYKTFCYIFVHPSSCEKSQWLIEGLILYWT